MRYADGWQAFPYIWNAEQTDAVLSPAGAVRGIAFVDATGTGVTANYLIPQKNQCANCHARKPDGASAPVMTLLGPSARQLHRTYDYGGAVGVENQLVRFADSGVLASVPSLDTITPTFDFRPIEAGGVAAVAPGDLDRAARDYLDANCAHCHNPSGVQGISSQLFLNHDNTDPFHLGICKQPGSAGLGTGGFKYDIVPGNPDASVLHYRITTTSPGAMMPLIGRSLCTHAAPSSSARGSRRCRRAIRRSAGRRRNERSVAIEVTRTAIARAILDHRSARAGWHGIVRRVDDQPRRPSLPRLHDLRHDQGSAYPGAVSGNM